jgi:hypothetical protein
MVFARETSDSLTSLVKKLDEATIANKKARMGSFVVFLSDDEKLEDKLKQIAEKENIKKTILCIDNPAGPKGYKVAKDADIVVVFYDRQDVKVNHSYRKGEFNAKAVEAVMKDLPKILSGD